MSYVSIWVPQPEVAPELAVLEAAEVLDCAAAKPATARTKTAEACIFCCLTEDVCRVEDVVVL